VIAVVVALAAGLSYGVSDFLAGSAGRRIPILGVTALSYVAALPVVGVATVLVPGAWSPAATGAGLLSGAFALVGFLAFYAALAAGPIAVLSPGIAVLQSVVPVVVGLTIGGERLGPIGVGGLVLAVVATPLLAMARGADGGRLDLRGIVLAIVASGCLGVSTVILDAAPVDSGVIPILLEVAVGAAVLPVLFAARRHRVVRALLAGIDAPAADGGSAAPAAATDDVAGQQVGRAARSAIRAAVAAGLLLGVANVCLMIALHAGDLAVVAVLIGLYPVATILLARIVLGERLSRIQLVGVVAALVACVMLGLGG